MTSIPLQGNRLHTLTAAVHVAAARGRDLHAAVGRFGFGASVGGTVVGLSLVHGGYAPAAWGWTALLGFWATLLGLVFRSDRRVDRAGVALVAGVAAVAGWTALSSTLDAERPAHDARARARSRLRRARRGGASALQRGRPFAARVGSRRRPRHRHRLCCRLVLREHSPRSTPRRAPCSSVRSDTPTRSEDWWLLLSRWSSLSLCTTRDEPSCALPARRPSCCRSRST